MTMTLVKLSYHSKLLHDPGLVQQTPLCDGEFFYNLSQEMEPPQLVVCSLLLNTGTDDSQ